MTTVSVVECISPVSLRTCGSSTSSLHNRKRLQTKSISPNKRSFQEHWAASRNIRDQGLDATLTTSPIPSPIPRSTGSLCGGKDTESLHLKSQSTTPVRFRECSFTDNEIPRAQSVVIPELCITGSKPRLHGIWEIKDSRQNTPLICQRLNLQDSELFDPEEDRASSTSPNNPPPSPINFMPSLDGFVVGGHRLICPERLEQGQLSYSRDFNPGFVKQPQHHCVKCQGRLIEEELTQVTLSRRLSSIMDRHASRHHISNQARDDICKEHQSTHQIRSPEHVSTHNSSQLRAHSSFGEIYAEKKRLKAEKERLERKQREIRIEEKRIDDLTKLKEKIQRKEQRSKKLIERYYVGKNAKVKTKNAEKSEDLQNAKQGNVNVTDSVTPVNDTDLHLPPISTPGSKSNSGSSLQNKKTASFQLLATDIKHSPNIARKEEVHTNAQRSRSYTAKDLENKIKASSEKALTDTEADKSRKPSAKKAIYLELSTPLNLSPWQQDHENKKPKTCFDSSTTLSSSKNVCMSVSTEENSELQDIKNNATNDNCTGIEISKLDITMTSTMIVPERDTPCSQWVSFNGDNEPVLNTSPEVDEGCDTFLKRLQRTKVINQNDPSLPSGQQFCFEAMVDKRYNRWKRRRRKKQSEARRTSVAQNSDSSDDERNAAMERIIDKMYVEIHGPVPQTPNGSRDTPRSRNRRRRKGENSAPVVQEEDDDIEEEGSCVSLYEASSELTSEGGIPSSSSAEQISRDQKETMTFTPAPEILQPSGSASEDLCSWPYLERYKTEILKRLKSTPTDQLEDMDQNDWLPDIKTPDITSNEKGGQNKSIDTGQPINSNFYIGSPDNSEWMDNEAGKNNQEDLALDNLCIKNKNENMEEQTDNIDVQKESDTSFDEFKPYIRIEKTPCQSRVETPENVADYYLTNYQSHSKHKTDPNKHMYTRWSRSQRPGARKTNSVEHKPKLVARSNVTSWNDVQYEQQDVAVKEETNTISAGDTNNEPSEYNPILADDSVPATKFRLSKKGQKVTMTIKKHNVSLPSLTKNSKSQTMAEFGGQISREKPVKIKQKSTRFVDHQATEERSRTQTPRNSTPTRGSLRESHTVPQFLFKDYYLRSLYGNKTRINSHVGTNKTGKGLKKTLTVDNLDLVAKQPKKKSDTQKARELAFTRSFTFSMFDLPDMYKLYNTTLERRANGEQIETQE